MVQHFYLVNENLKSYLYLSLDILQNEAHSK